MIDDDAIRAREMRLAGYTTVKISATLYYCPRVIQDAILGHTHQHITDPPPVPIQAKRLTDEQVKEARTLRSQYWSIKALAERYNRTQATISNAVTGNTYKHITDPPPVRFNKKRTVNPLRG